MQSDRQIEQQIRSALTVGDAPSFDGDLDLRDPPVPVTAQAAVLVLINAFDNPAIVLTKRNATMRKHAGQVAFPGGRIDATDSSAWAAARREAYEEIGLPLAHPLTRIGQLPNHKTITGFNVTPLVAINYAAFEFRAEPNEVDAIFELPLDRLRRENFAVRSHIYQGIPRSYYTMEFNGFEIWGATARMLYNLATGLEHVNS